MSGGRDPDVLFRESTRAPLEAPVTLQIDAFRDPEPGYTGDISVGGMFVRVSDPQPVGTILRFELDLEAPAGLIRGTADVVWIRPRAQAPDRPAGMGVQFRFIEEDGAGRLRAAVMKAIEELGLPPVPETGPEVVARREARSARAPSSPSRETQPSPAPPKPAAQRPAVHEARPSPSPLGRLRGSAKLIVALVLLGVLAILLLRLVA